MQNLIAFFRQDLDLSVDLIQKISKYYIEEQFDKDEFLIKKGQYCRKLCLIRSGYFRFHSYSDRKTITHWIFGTGQLTTDVASFYLMEPAKWNIQALTSTSVYTLTHSKYEQLKNEIEEWNQYEHRLLVKLMSALENRVYALLSMTAEQRYQYLFDSDSNMFNELPLQYLASMLGMTPETLSRIRAKSIS